MMNQKQERNAAVLSSWPTFFHGKDSDCDSLTALYHPKKGTLIDHAFNVSRTGKETLDAHWKLWLHAIPDFTAEVVSVTALDDGGWLQYRGKGTFVNTLANYFPPTGKEFVYEAILRAWIDDDGLIVRSEEWYTKSFGESRPVNEYNHREDGDE